MRGGWVDEWGWGWVGAPPMHVRTHMRTHAHYWFGGVPPLGGGWVDGWGGVEWGHPHACVHTHVHARTLLIWGGNPPWGVGWVDGWGWGWVGALPMHVCIHMCMHAHACTCAHTCMHVKHDKNGCLHGGSHLQFPNIFILAFRACVCMHMHVHVSRDTPPCPQMPPNPSGLSPEPQGAQITKSL